MHNIKMRDKISQEIKFGDKEVDKKKIYSSKKAILLDSVDFSKIVVSSRWKRNDTTYKYFCRYLNNDVIEPLCVILPQMSGYILIMVEKICHLLQMIKKFMRNMTKYGM